MREVFERLSKMSNEEFMTLLSKHEGTPLARLIHYGMDPEGYLEQEKSKQEKSKDE